MKKELLCPVGSKEALHAAIHNGADAVYLAGKSFGARAYAKNFNDDELREAIEYAHLYGVKVYVTVNTLMKDNEINEALNFIDFLHKNNVDAVIIQDIGLATLIHHIFPKLEMHASTQFHNLDSSTCQFLEKIGFKRVVMARELSLEEINKLNTNLEIEVFIHGALCISYSGICLLSSMAKERSGNRGACAQLCRMPYALEIEDKEIPAKGKYLISPRDLNTVSIFQELLESKITSFKIEGRMKSPEYIVTTTKLYRALIDQNKDVLKYQEDLKSLFNRGYSLGHLKNDQEIINSSRGNHQGIPIGEVLSVDDKQIKIKLSGELRLKDGIKFEQSDLGMTIYNLYQKDIQIKEAKSEDIITIPNNINLKTKDNVLKTFDNKLSEEILKYPEKKITIKIELKAIINKKLTLTISDGINTVTKEGEIVEKSTNQPVTTEVIREKILKLGNTPFISEDINIVKDDSIFIRLSDLNNLRRECTDSLIDLRKYKLPYQKNKYQELFTEINCQPELNIYVRNQEQLNTILNYDYIKIYTDNYILFQNNKHLNIYYEVKINEETEFNNEKLLITSTSDIIKYQNNQLVLDYSLNILNSYSLQYLTNYGTVTYSPELKIEDLKQINKNIISSGEYIVYGRPKVMTMKHCIINKDCSSCKLNNKKRVLKDAFNNKYPIYCHKQINYLYDYKNINYLNQLEELKKLGITKFRIDFLEENQEEIKKILNIFYNDIK